MKKVFSKVIIIFVIFAFTSCTKTGEEDKYTAVDSMFKDIEQDVMEWGYPTDELGTADAPAVLAAGTYKVGVCIYNFDSAFMTNYRNEIEAYFKTLETDDVKFEVTIADGKNDMMEQSAQIDAFVADKVDVLILNLVSTSSAGDVVERAKTAGIPIVYIYREPNSTDEMAWEYKGKIAYVGVDSRQIGTYQGEIIRDLSDHGDIDGDGIVRYITLTGDLENVDTYYRISMRFFEQSGYWDRAKSQELTANAISQFGDAIDVILANNDEMALGAIDACKEAGLQVGKDVYIVGTDATEAALAAITAGDLTGTVMNDYINQARVAVNVATLAINGDDLLQYYFVDYVKITA